MALKRPADAQDEAFHGHGPLKRFKADSQHVSPVQVPRASLLGLPTELRLRIYEHLFGHALIHISTRPCKPYDKGAFRPNALLPSWGPLSRAWKKWTHTLCQVPDDWGRAYALSKETMSVDHFTAESSTEGHLDDIPDYYTRHDACSWIQDDFQDRKYNYACSHAAELAHRPHFCLEQEDYARKMTEAHGLPEEGGLERLHRDSKLHLDILSVCRQIHNEAALIPYETSIFNFDYPATMQDFIEQAIQPHQAAAIRNLHTGSWQISDLAIAADQLPGLQYLQYNWVGGSSMKWPTQFPRVDSLIDEPHFTKVEVMFSCGQYSGMVLDRAGCRRRAEQLERDLTLLPDCKMKPRVRTPHK